MVTIDFSGKVILVCGSGGGGCGSAVTHALLSAGATVAALDWDEAHHDVLREEAGNAGDRLTTFTVDLTNPEQRNAAVAQVLAKMGRIDGLVNVTGGTLPHHWRELATTPDKDRIDLFALNFDYAARIASDVAQHLTAEQRPGSIVNFSSISGLRSSPYHGYYGAAKAAIIAITKTMAVEWFSRGIRVNAITPGGVVTERTKAFTRDETMGAADSRQVFPEEIAGAVLFFLSDLASGVSGQALVVDAGKSAFHPSGGANVFSKVEQAW